MTSENQAGNDSPVVDGSAGGGPDTDADRGETGRPPARNQPGAPGATGGVRQPSRPRVLDWEREPEHGVDPEDSRGGRTDDLARLLDDVPPHHVDH